MSFNTNYPKQKIWLRILEGLLIIITIFGAFYIIGLSCNSNLTFARSMFINKYNQPNIFPLSLIITFIALIISLLGFRFQIVSMINKQLSEMAGLCNTNVDSFSQTNSQILNKSTQNVSHLVSTIISSKQMLDAYYKDYNFILLNWGKQSCLDIFYLQLHTSIRVYLFEHELPKDIDRVKCGTDESLMTIIKDQIISSNQILQLSHQRFDLAQHK